jgi:serine/threonine-protein kinase RsbT
MTVLREALFPVAASEDIVIARRVVREWAIDLGFSLVEQTKIVTAASELARNTVVHGGGGTMRLQRLEESRRSGLKIVFEDTGPGIVDIDRAMRDGYTTGGGLGLGLGGARRLCNDFELTSTPGKGTRVSITRWRQ